MNKSISPAAITGVLIVVLAIALFLGFRWMSGGPNADVTQQNLDHWKQAAGHPAPKGATGPAAQYSH